ncbi:MAG TPA: helix-hairpin-helix domain-containing protein [Solimonas sp.]
MKAIMLSIMAMLFSAAVWAAGININTADKKTLDKLEGVGPAKAEAIIKYRTENGGFKSPEDLRKVPGIGDSIYEANKALIKVKD